MAIIYTKELPEDRLLMSFNNNILKFHSDNTIQALNCEVTLGGLNPIVLYPTPDGKFTLNVKDYVNSIISSNYFIDDLDFDITTEYIYDWTDRTLTSGAISLTINFIDATSESDTIYPTFLSSYAQEMELNDQFDDKRLYLLHNCERVNFQLGSPVYLKWFVGYPFDFTFYNNLNAVTFKERFVATPTFTKTTKQVNRCFISDGTNESEIAVLFDDGNTIQVTSTDLASFYIKIEKEVVDCFENKHYLKWINRFGGWNYWLFEYADVSRNTKDLGNINNNFSNIENTISRNIQIGKQSQDRMQLTTDVINEQVQTLLIDLLDSPKVMLFKGTPTQPNNYNDWVEVAISQSNYPIKNAKNILTEWRLTIELPLRDNRTI